MENDHSKQSVTSGTQSLDEVILRYVDNQGEIKDTLTWAQV